MGALRFILAMSVAYGHAGDFLGFPLIPGDTAVQCFYAVSGFYMALVLNEKYRPQSSSYFLFISNRFARLFPAYAAVLCLTLIFAAVSSPELPFVSRWHSLPALDWWSAAFLIGSQILMWGQDLYFYLTLKAGALTFWPDFHTAPEPIIPLLVIPQGWTLGLEFSFYLIAPFIVRRSAAAIVSVLAASLALRLLLQLAGYSGDPWSYRFFPSELAVFLLGALGYRVYKLSAAELVGSASFAFGSDDRTAVPSHNIPACHSGRASRALPGERELESSNQSGTCIHAGRGLLGPGSHDPGGAGLAWPGRQPVCDGPPDTNSGIPEFVTPNGRTRINPTSAGEGSRLSASPGLDSHLARVFVVAVLCVGAALLINRWNGLSRVASVVFFTLAVLAIPLLFRASKNWQFDRLLGELSYPIYICHVLVIWCLDRAVALGTGYARGLTIMAMTIAFSCVLYWLIDRPIDAWRQRRFDRERALVSPALPAAQPGL